MFKAKRTVAATGLGLASVVAPFAEMPAEAMRIPPATEQGVIACEVSSLERFSNAGSFLITVSMPVDVEKPVVLGDGYSPLEEQMQPATTLMARQDGWEQRAQPITNDGTFLVQYAESGPTIELSGTGANGDSCISSLPIANENRQPT